MRLRWTAEEVDEKVKRIMRQHDVGVEHGRRSDGSVDYLNGSIIAGFLRVADAMLDQGY